MHDFKNGDLVQVIRYSMSSLNWPGDVGRVVRTTKTMIRVEVEGRPKVFNSHIAADLKLIESGVK